MEQAKAWEILFSQKPTSGANLAEAFAVIRGMEELDSKVKLKADTKQRASDFLSDPDLFLADNAKDPRVPQWTQLVSAFGTTAVTATAKAVPVSTSATPTKARTKALPKAVPSLAQGSPAIPVQTTPVPAAVSKMLKPVSAAALKAAIARGAVPTKVSLGSTDPQPAQTPSLVPAPVPAPSTTPAPVIATQLPQAVQGASSQPAGAHGADRGRQERTRAWGGGEENNRHTPPTDIKESDDARRAREMADQIKQVQQAMARTPRSRTSTSPEVVTLITREDYQTFRDEVLNIFKGPSRAGLARLKKKIRSYPGKHDVGWADRLKVQQHLERFIRALEDGVNSKRPTWFQAVYITPGSYSD